MKKRLLRILAGAALTGISVFAFVYHLPVDRSGTYALTVMNRPDGTVPVYETAEMEITLHRFFLRPTIVRGEITLGEQTYLDIRSKWSGAFDSYSFGENLERKTDGMLNAWFVREEVRIGTGYLDDYILLENGDTETFRIFHYGDDCVLYRAEFTEEYGK